MAKNGKLNKWRCLIKRWNSSAASPAPPHPHPTSVLHRPVQPKTTRGTAARMTSQPDSTPTTSASLAGVTVRSFLVEHPFFSEPRGAPAVDGATVVGCEVVLFEHLLWMLENADPKPESLDELVDFYAC
ncbi:hypothetical protein HPP92_002117 [Vanilla planifolia]|uniref:Uncharacterized protein n=1 Tax=Vanilla planifolia TaxID=51239 RepID=A0A835VM23_VANPL|nr:hypothetical protein HPP92_002117 [Vanilla planifolia]